MFASTATRKRRLHTIGLDPNWRPFRGLFSIRGILPNSEAAQILAPRLWFHPSRTLVGVDKVGNRYFTRVEEIDGISKPTLNLFFSLASRIH
ncbi:hypothetical protein B296_00040117 [Ensete ventricosum]|uniref:Uncharacterized protein n=1 Tax=Ensete ventricosum TaxID=4639 RepID=A0A426Y346_ENSVE|nr:hypothetical protein B296_00040117 [Ensete ventricosum]